MAGVFVYPQPLGTDKGSMCMLDWNTDFFFLFISPEQIDVILCIANELHWPFAEGKGDILMDPLMVDWFNLIRKKQTYIRRESELVYM